MDKMFFNSRPPLVFMRISTQNNEEPLLIILKSSQKSKKCLH